MKERIFYGKVNTTNGGVGQLKENYLVGPEKWFGEMKKGDVAIISEDGGVKNIRKVIDIKKEYQDENDTYLRYTFEKIFENDFEPEKTPQDILYTKYFKFDKVSANYCYRRNPQNFNKLNLNEEYTNLPVKKLDFNKEAYKSIYFLTSENILKDQRVQIKPRDIFFVVEKNEYKIKEIYNYENGIKKNILWNEISETLNIEKYGLKKALEIDIKYKWKDKARLLEQIINSINEQEYYEQPHEAGLATLYDALIVKEEYSPKNKKTLTNSGEINYKNITKIKNLDEKLQKTDEDCSLNQIFYGVPGCGKSYKVKKILEENGIDSKHNEKILFHPEYSYIDFVGQLEPKVIKNDVEDKSDVTYKFAPGPFSKILKKALLNKYENYVLVIDEINRGNASAIFGDVFQLLDRNKKGESEFSIKNEKISEYLKDGNDGSGTIDIEDIRIPHNLYIFATMNTSDQNVFTLDNAFKRRWYFEKVSNEFNKEEKHQFIPIKDLKDDAGKNIKWGAFQTQINDIITKELLAYGIDGEDKQLGKYFVTEEELKNKKKFAYKVLMYLWEDVVKVNRDILFDTEKYKTLDKLIEDFLNESIGMKVFKFKNTKGEKIGE